MPPTVKVNEISTGRPETAQRPASTTTLPGDTAIKQQPVALEVPVTVNGARAVEGSDKREPFSETTKTVLIFGNGAVIRLSSSVAPGQLLFLTNEKTRKEVVCQVVKSKNYRNVSGYVELQFTESVVGFWGMRFPGDRIGSVAQPVAPAPNVTPSVVAAKPAVPVSAVRVAEPKRAESKFVIPATPKVEEPLAQKPVAPVARLSSTLSTSFDPEAPLSLHSTTPREPVVPVVPVAPVSATPELSVNSAIEKPAPTASVFFDSPRTSESQASFLEPAKTPTVPLVPVAAVFATLELSVNPAPIKPVAPASMLFDSPHPHASEVHAPLLEPPKTPAAPVVPVAPGSAIPELSVNSAPAKPVPSASMLFDSPRAPEVQASILEPANASAVPLVTSVPNLLSLFEAKPAAPAVVPPPPAPPSAHPVTEALKQQTARLQEQLSGMMFSGESPTPATVSVQIPHETPVVIEEELVENAAKVLEMSHIHKPEPAPVRLEPLPAKSSLEVEELKIPAWLEPLARNAAVPSATQELIEREKTERLEEQPGLEATFAETVTPVEEHYIPELPLPTFGDALPLDEEKGTSESGLRSSRKGILIGAIAAGVLLLAGGGWWYMQQQSGGVHAGSAQALNAQASVASLPVASTPSQPLGNVLPQTNPPAQSNSATLKNTSAPSNSAANTLSAAPASPSATTTHSSQPTSNPASGGAAATTSASARPAAEPTKKPLLGEVHLAKPKVAPSRRAQNSGEPDAGIALSNEELPDSGAEALNAGLVGGNEQPSAPTAPLSVGGDVKQAKLISSMPPAYPALAKTQRVSGSVLVDALIDANGRVTSMKVVSGPTLLQQAAMDALKQWKYRPASLNGNPVPMHLAVTIQFRLQ